MSAYTALEEKFNFNEPPPAPPGCKVVINENPDTTITWSPHGSLVSYIVPTMDIYRCIQVYVNATISERVGDKV